MPIVLADTASNPYLQAVALIERLDTDLAIVRAAKALTLAQQAAQIGISPTTLAKVGPDTNSTENTIVACLTWLANN